VENEYSEEVTIDRVEKDELPSILALLDQCGLPKENLGPHLSTTLVARNDSRVVGCSILELYDECALLAYVAVEQPFQRRGLGQRLTKEALDLAKHRGVGTVYLLTETAGTFFSKMGFESIPRSDVPQKVQHSSEFTTLCPITAQVMRISLKEEIGHQPHPIRSRER